MQTFERPSLPRDLVASLERRQARIDESANPAEIAREQWSQFRNPDRKDVRSHLREMCSGIERCMYCEDGNATDIDHLRPKNYYPNRTFDWNNLFLACSYCNSNRKRDAYPLGPDGEELLLDPSRDDPADHLALSPTTGYYIPLDSRGAATAETFGLNREVCVRGRRNMWTTLCYAIECYLDDPNEQKRALRIVKETQFQGVRRQMRLVYKSSKRDEYFSAKFVNIVTAHPELLND